MGMDLTGEAQQFVQMLRQGGMGGFGGTPQELLAALQERKGNAAAVLEAMAMQEGKGAGMGAAARSLDARVTSIEDGSGEAYATRVTPESNLGAESQYRRTSVETTYPSVGTSSSVIVDPDAARLQVVLQNTHDTESIHIRIDGTATTSDLILGPRERWSFPPGVGCALAINGIAGGSVSVDVVAIEYFA